MVRLNKLSAREVEALKKDGVSSDGAGLYVRVRGGAKHFLFIYRFDGRRREMGLGAPPAVSLKVARERAQLARELLTQGKDPAIEKRVVAARPTFGALADEWMESQAPKVRSSKSIDRWKRALGERGYCAALREKRIDMITTEDVLGILKPIWSKGPTAALTRGYIEKVLDAAKARGFRNGENPARWKGHLDHLLAKPPKLQRGHHAAMPYADIPLFMQTLRDRKTLAARFVEFVILTAARLGEALGATWHEFDLERGVWAIPGRRMKAGRDHTVPLSARALTILRDLKPEDAQPNDRAFTDKGKPLSNMAGPMLLRRSKVNATMHGFRSSFRDWAGDCTEFPREVAEAALAHTLGGVEASYRRSNALERRRGLMEAWAAYCEQRPVTKRAADKPARKSSSRKEPVVEQLPLAFEPIGDQGTAPGDAVIDAGHLRR